MAMNEIRGGRRCYFARSRATKAHIIRRVTILDDLNPMVFLSLLLMSSVTYTVEVSVRPTVRRTKCHQTVYQCFLMKSLHSTKKNTRRFYVKPVEIYTAYIPFFSSPHGEWKCCTSGGTHVSYTFRYIWVPQGSNSLIKQYYC